MKQQYCEPLENLGKSFVNDKEVGFQMKNIVNL